MLTIKKENLFIKNINAAINTTIDINLETVPSHYIFFDIETTGLKKESTFVYFIGCIYFQDHHWNLIQFFNEDGCSEKEILASFFSLLSKDSCLIHYNGTRFDVPYLDYRRKLYGFDINLYNFSHIDLYKEFSKFSKLLLLSQKKQKDIENFFGIKREDKLSGKQLISVYHSYLNEKTEELFSLLTLHNNDDLLGLFSLFTCFLPYEFLSCITCLDNHNFSINAISKNTTSKNAASENTVSKSTLLKNNMANTNVDTALSLSFSLPLSLPKEIRRKKDGIYFHIEKNNGIFSFPIRKTELKFFYPNYKDYYYLTEEDYAIHKSIAQYVDKNYRRKATAKTCYQRKESEFFPIFPTFPKNNLDSFEQFRINYTDKQIYIEYTENLSNDFWKLYIHSYYLHLMK